mmetsp:Transcript_160/g.266  ORF Transcript_160/g.266 Transcript_160/m.266 type:complete len:206 (-) Transcript_160:327-944(-)
MHCHNGCCPDLHLLLAARIDLLPRCNLLLECQCVLQDAHLSQHHRHPVISKHGELMHVPKRPKPLALKSSKHVADPDLRTLVQEYLSRLIHCMITEARKGGCDQLTQPYCRTLCCSHQVGCTARIRLQQAFTNLSKQPCSFILQGHVSARPADQLADIRSRHGGQTCSAQSLRVFQQSSHHSASQMLILQAWCRPKTEIERIDNE